MPTIETYLEKIKTASYGEEVRDSIYQSIRMCYEDGQGAGSVDIVARERLNEILERNGGSLTETTLWEGEAFWNGQSFELSGDPSTYEYVYVYYKITVTADPEIYIYKASNFAANPSVLTGFYTSGGQSTAARLLRINIRKNTDISGNWYQVYNIAAWSWDGNAAHAASIVTPEESGDHEAGTITKITGVKYVADPEISATHIGSDGTEYQSLSARLDAIEERIGSIGSGGLSEQAKTLLMSNLRIALYKEDASQSLDDLEEALGGEDPTANYTITNNLTNVTNSNSARRIAEGESYTGQLTSTTTAPISSVIVTMGGTDITASAYNSSTRTITINSVTGNIVITASAPGGGGGGDDDWTSGVPYSGITWESGSLNFSTGEVVENASYKVSEFIPCHGASALDYSGLGANNGRSVVYYNTNHEFISSPAVLPSSNQLPVIVPTSAYFFRTIKANSQTNEVITPYLYQTATENTAWHDGERFLANGGMFLCYGASTLQCGYNARTYYYFYDAEKNLIDSIIRQNDATAITIPSGSYYCKIANGDSRYWAQLFA